MRTAVYAGTFDPITSGHLSVIARGAKLFDSLVVLVAVNPNKQPVFGVSERLAMIQEATADWPNVSCDSTRGYVVEYAGTVRAQYLIRGVRSCTEVEEEIDLANLNHSLAPDIETVFVPAHPHLSEVSSSELKALARKGADISKYCTPAVAERLKQRLGHGAIPTKEACYV